MKFPFPFKFESNEITISTTTAAASSWPWSSCATTPRTLSFRADTFYKTISPAYLDHDDQLATATPHKSLSPHHHDEPSNPESAVISGLRSERLFFDPGATSSIVAEAKTDDDDAGGESESVAVVVMDSRNPFLDFRVSMAEMVEACGLRDWEFLEELLEWYLRVNDESNHGYIVGAFVDLLISAIHEESSSYLSSSSSAATKYSFASPFSLSSSSTEEEILVHKNE